MGKTKDMIPVKFKARIYNWHLFKADLIRLLAVYNTLNQRQRIICRYRAELSTSENVTMVIYLLPTAGDQPEISSITTQEELDIKARYREAGETDSTKLILTFVETPILDYLQTEIDKLSMPKADYRLPISLLILAMVAVTVDTLGGVSTYYHIGNLLLTLAVTVAFAKLLVKLEFKYKGLIYTYLIIMILSTIIKVYKNVNFFY